MQQKRYRKKQFGKIFHTAAVSLSLLFFFCWAFAEYFPLLRFCWLLRIYGMKFVTRMQLSKNLSKIILKKSNWTFHLTVYYFLQLFRMFYYYNNVIMANTIEYCGLIWLLVCLDLFIVFDHFYLLNCIVCGLLISSIQSMYINWMRPTTLNIPFRSAGS